MRHRQGQFLTFVRKEFYHLLRDRRTVLIVIVIPIVLIILFGFAITTEVRNAKVAVYNPSNDVVAQRIIERLDAGEYFDIIGTLGSQAEVEDLFRRGEASMVVVFGSDFQADLLRGKTYVQLLADGSEPNQASSQTAYASQIITAAAEEIIREAGVDTDTPMSITPVIRMLYNPQMKSAYNFVPGVMGMIMMLICAMMTAIAIVREKETGTMEILLVSPIRPIFIILAKIMPYLAVSIINMITILLLAVFMLRVPVSGSLGALVLVTVIYMITVLSLGLLISNLTKTQTVAMIISVLGLIMPTMILSGMIFPVESMPEVLQWLSTVLPVRWYIDAARKLMIQGVAMQFVLKETLILTGMTIALLVISLKTFKIRLH
jgi:ABC-2 type transport system permease protein